MEVVAEKVHPTSDQTPRPTGSAARPAWAFWRSPVDQPAWSRPLLLAIAVLASTVYAWDIGDRPVESYYAAAVRSMSQSWNAFVFGALDPAGSITVDKIPGFLWPQALSVRLFGFHPWAMMLPQVVAAVLTVLVLHRVVRRHAGPVAAPLAALTMTLTPVVAALAHAQWPDTLLILLLVLAADATLRATDSGSLRTLLLAGVWVGLAVHAKMLVAWGLLPALAVTYLLTAPHPLRRRLGHVGSAGLVTLAVSSAWVLVAWLTPAASRPWIDSSGDNDPLGMVLLHNGIKRFSESAADSGYFGPAHDPGGTALFGWLAPQVMWLFPLALVGLVVGLLQRGPSPRTDLARAGLILWGGWLLTFGAVLSVARVNHSAYVILLAPPLAALTGTGLVALWTAYRNPGRLGWLLPAAVAATVTWSVVVTERFPDFLTWLTPTAAVLGVVAVVALLLGRVRRDALVRLVALTVGTAAVLVAPAAWALSTTDRQYSGYASSPSAGPFGVEWWGAVLSVEEAQQLTAFQQMLKQLSPEERDARMDADIMLTPFEVAMLDHFRATTGGSRYLFAVATSGEAGRFITAAGVSVLPLGGWSRDEPYPDRDTLLRLLHDGDLRYVVVRSPDTVLPGTETAANLDLVRQRCAPIDPRKFDPTLPAPGPEGAAQAAAAMLPPPPEMYDCAAMRGVG